MQDANQSNVLKGFLLSLATAALWGILPLFLLICLDVMDSKTITLYRFAFAALVVAFLLSRKRQLAPLLAVPVQHGLLAVFAALMLVLNYVTNVIGLIYLSPGSVQLLMQIAPLVLMAGGVWLYKEPFNRSQFVGVIILLLGLLLFFQQRLPDIVSSPTENPIGIAIMLFSALVWAAYALVQKRLFTFYSSHQINLMLYAFGALLLLPFSDLSSLKDVSQTQLLALVFCCFNTLFAYGAFAEAMKVWQASRVSAVLAITPLITLVSNKLASLYWPERFTVPELSLTAMAGAGLVITGSVICALARAKSAEPKKALT